MLAEYSMALPPQSAAKRTLPTHLRTATETGAMGTQHARLPIVLVRSAEEPLTLGAVRWVLRAYSGTDSWCYRRYLH